MRFYLKDFDLNDLISQTAKELAAIIRPDTKLEIHTARLPIMVHADKAKLKHVLTNLIDNANKYTESGEIRLKTEKRGEKIHIELPTVK